VAQTLNVEKQGQLKKLARNWWRLTLKESGELDEDTRRAISAAFADRRRAQIANAA